MFVSSRVSGVQWFAKAMDVVLPRKRARKDSFRTAGFPKSLTLKRLQFDASLYFVALIPLERGIRANTWLLYYPLPDLRKLIYDLHKVVHILYKQGFKR